MMNKKELDILEKAFDAEIASAFNKNLFPIIQTKSKTAKKLCENGYLEEVCFMYSNVKITGYAITIRGHIAYCDSDRCKNVVDDIGDV